MRTTQILIPSTLGNVSATMYFPDTVGQKLLVLCPGYLDSKDYHGLSQLAELMCKKHDYTVINFDPTGTWLSCATLRDYNLTQCLRDMHAVIEYCKMERDVRCTQVMVGGHSFGATVAIHYAARYGGVQGVLAIMPLVHPRFLEEQDTWCSQGIKTSKRDMPNNPSIFVQFVVPYTFMLDYLQYDLELETHIVQAPVVVIGGEHDTTCTIPHIAEYCRNYSGVYFTYISKVGHNYRLSETETLRVNTFIEYVLLRKKLLR